MGTITTESRLWTYIIELADQAELATEKPDHNDVLARAATVQWAYDYAHADTEWVPDAEFMNEMRCYYAGYLDCLNADREITVTA